jgi:hypothetical protein
VGPQIFITQQKQHMKITLLSFVLLLTVSCAPLREFATPPPVYHAETGRLEAQPPPTSNLDVASGTIDNLLSMQRQIDTVASQMPGTVSSLSGGAGALLGGLSLILHGMRKKGTTASITEALSIMAARPRPVKTGAAVGTGSPSV